MSHCGHPMQKEQKRGGLLSRSLSSFRVAVTSPYLWHEKEKRVLAPTVRCSMQEGREEKEENIVHIKQTGGGGGRGWDIKTVEENCSRINRHMCVVLRMAVPGYVQEQFSMLCQTRRSEIRVQYPPERKGFLDHKKQAARLLSHLCPPTQ